MLTRAIYCAPVSNIYFDSSSEVTAPLADIKTASQVPEPDSKLVCYICQCFVTDNSQRIDIEGKNTHYRSNPAGYRYTFDCFGQAPGCRPLGLPTLEYTWFNGHHWQITACRECGEHLGWLFKGPSRFFGLIQGRIVKARD